MRRSFIGIITAVAVTATLFGAFAAPASAGTWTVNAADVASDGDCDDVDCSLRDAIDEANANLVGTDTINLTAGPHIITQVGTDNLNAIGDFDTLVGSGSLVVQGAGMGLTTIDANGLDRVLELRSSTVIRDVAIVGGATTGEGGGIYSSAALTLERVRLADNTADANGGGLATSGAVSVTISNSILEDNSAVQAGGGLLNAGTTMTIDRSSISNNQTTSDPNGNAGGIWHSTGTLNVTNSTLHFNQANFGGGAVATSGGSTATFTNVTFEGNQADADGDGGFGPALWTQGTVTLRNSLLLDNVIDTTEATCSSQGGGTVNTNGNNLYDAQGLEGCSFSGTDILSATGGAGTYGDTMGGLTKVTPIDQDSPAVNAGNPAHCASLTTDQRGAPRTVGASCDIGAFEVGGYHDAAVTIGAAATTATIGGSVQLTGTWVNNGGTDPAIGTTMTMAIPAGTELLSAVSGNGISCGAAASVVTCTRASINSNESVNWNLTMRIDTVGSKAFTMSIAADGTDTSPSNNSATTTVSGAAPVVVTPPPPPAPAPVAPAVQVLDAGKLLPVKKGKFSIRVKCPAGVAGNSCDISMVFTTAKKYAKAKARKVTFTCSAKGVAAGTTRAVTCTIPKKALKALAKAPLKGTGRKAQRIVPVSVRATSKAIGGGAASVTTASLRLKL
jgi:Domain of unknown function DUF11